MSSLNLTVSFTRKYFSSFLILIATQYSEFADALTSSWSMIAASIVLLTGQVGFTMLELAQTYKKNRDYIVMKNLIVLLTVMLTWFCFGYAIAFGTNNNATDIQFGGFYHGWFGDLSGGLSIDPNLVFNESAPIITVVPVNVTTDLYISQQVLDISYAFNQRRFFVFFCFIVLASNIATSSISERCNMMPMVWFVVVQNLLIIPISLCWTYARPLFGSVNASGGVGFLYNFGFFDRAGAIPIIYSGALSSLVAAAVLGPRYGVFMPIED